MRTEVEVHDARSGQVLGKHYLVETVPSWVPMTRPQIDAVFGRGAGTNNGRAVGHCRLITADMMTLSAGLWDDRAEGPYFYTYKKVKGVGITLAQMEAARGGRAESPFSPPRPSRAVISETSPNMDAVIRDVQATLAAQPSMPVWDTSVLPPTQTYVYPVLPPGTGRR